MDEEARKALAKKEHTPTDQKFLEDAKTHIALSRSTMSTYYDQWDINDMVYRNRQPIDTEDRNAARRKEPIKMVVPVSYAQVQAFVALGMQLYTQRDRFFELTAIGSDDINAAKVAEAFLDRDLRYNVWEARLHQFLLDIARFGVGILKCCWTRDTQYQLVAGQLPGGASTYAYAPVLKYAGNKIYNISPYQYFPDPRISIARTEEGEFVGHEQVYSRVTLQQWESEGKIAGVEHIDKCSQQVVDLRGVNRIHGLSRNSGGMLTPATENSTVIVTEILKSIVPADYEVDGKPIGKEKYPVKYLFWYANDSRLIKREPYGYLHNEYLYKVAEYGPDVLNFSNCGLMDGISLLQDTMSWFINSRVTNVRKIIGDRLIVDPTGIEMADIRDRAPVIRLKPNASKLGVDKYVKQLDLVDVTTNHVQDALVLRDFIRETTGINETLMGEVASGRRSATENRNATNAALARVKMLYTLIYRTAIEPMGRQMLSNLRDGLDEQQVVKLVGPELALESAGQFVKADKTQLIGNYDFESLDASLPSEKSLNAQALGEILQGFITNPQAAIALRIDPIAVLRRWLELRGFRHPDQFMLKGPLPNVTDPNNILQGPGLTPPGTAPGVPSPTGQPVLPTATSGGSGGGEY